VKERFSENVMRDVREGQKLKPDGRISGYTWEAVARQPGDDYARPEFFFNSAYAIALRSEDPELRAESCQTMRQFLDWYVYPVKRNRATGLITGSIEKVQFPIDAHDGSGGLFLPVQSRAPLNLNVAIALSARLTARFATELGRIADADHYDRLFAELKSASNMHLWDERNGAYYDLNLNGGRLFKYRSVEIFFPFRLGIAPEDRRRRLIERLVSPKEFDWGRSPVPDGDLMERSPAKMIAMLINSPIIDGLEESGRSDLAAELNWSCLRFYETGFSEWYTLSGNRFGGKDYGFSLRLYLGRHRAPVRRHLRRSSPAVSDNSSRTAGIVRTRVGVRGPDPSFREGRTALVTDQTAIARGGRDPCLRRGWTAWRQH
jgi:hypothetical protein